MKVEIHMKTGTGLNDRKHWRVKAKGVKTERIAVGWALVGAKRPTLPCTMLLTRVAPSRGLDDDNLVGAMKGCRDAVAEWLGIDDRDPRVLWRYEQRRGVWTVEIESRTRAQEIDRLQAMLGAGA